MHSRSSAAAANLGRKSKVDLGRTSDLAAASQDLPRSPAPARWTTAQKSADDCLQRASGKAPAGPLRSQRSRQRVQLSDRPPEANKRTIRQCARAFQAMPSSINVPPDAETQEPLIAQSGATLRLDGSITRALLSQRLTTRLPCRLPEPVPTLARSLASRFAARPSLFARARSGGVRAAVDLGASLKVLSVDGRAMRSSHKQTMMHCPSGCLSRARAECSTRHYYSDTRPPRCPGRAQKIEIKEMSAVAYGRWREAPRTHGSCTRLHPDPSSGGWWDDRLVSAGRWHCCCSEPAPTSTPGGSGMLSHQGLFEPSPPLIDQPTLGRSERNRTGKKRI